MQQRRDLEDWAAPVVEELIRFFQWMPNWLNITIGTSCWLSAVYTMFIAQNHMTFGRLIGFGMIPALVGTIMGMVYMIKNRPRS